MDIPNSPVAVGYVMNPRTETVLEGDSLRTGMVVLVADQSLRTGPHAEEFLNVTNRWCRIHTDTQTHYEPVVSYGVPNTDVMTVVRARDECVLFAGEYADGTRELRRYNSDTEWFVKVDSIGAPE